MIILPSEEHSSLAQSLIDIWWTISHRFYANCSRRTALDFGIQLQNQRRHQWACQRFFCAPHYKLRSFVAQLLSSIARFGVKSMMDTGRDISWVSRVFKRSSNHLIRHWVDDMMKRMIFDKGTIKSDFCFPFLFFWSIFFFCFLIYVISRNMLAQQSSVMGNHASFQFLVYIPNFVGSIRLSIVSHDLKSRQNQLHLNEYYSYVYH